MKRYHGTNLKSVQKILKNIDITCGGGELGKGFYVGNLAHQAFAWAYHKGLRYKDGYKVICFLIDKVHFNTLNRKYLSRQEARNNRALVRKNHTQKSYIYNVDAVISPIVGKYIPHFTQIKFESTKGQIFINATTKFLLP